MSDDSGRVRRLASRSVSWHRPDRLTVAAVVVPVLALAAALLVSTEQESGQRVAPEETPLTRATLVCPPGGDEVDLASVSGVGGNLDVRAGDDRADVEVAPDRTTSLELGRRAAIITGRDDLAPGLVASRYQRPWESMDCRAPVVDQWFTGVGAGAKHQSLLQLVNPDGGRAVVDIEVFGRRGPVSAPALRGLAITGGETRRFDLAEVIPRRDDLALHVTTLRGRISASVLDNFQELGRGPGGRDGLASQDQPSVSNLLLGLPQGRGQRTLIIANPGDDEGRATVRLVTADSVFTPAAAEDVRLPPQSVVRVGLAPLLKGARGNDQSRPLGVQVDSSVEATVGLVMFVRGDLVHSVPTPPVGVASTVALPKADKELVLGGASSQGVATVTVWDRKGDQLSSERIEVARDRGYRMSLPGKARLLTLTPEKTGLEGVVLLSGDGATLVGIREPVLTGLEPFVEPGLP
jgi:hypothetical protein